MRDRVIVPGRDIWSKIEGRIDMYRIENLCTFAHYIQETVKPRREVGGALRSAEWRKRKRLEAAFFFRGV